MEHVVNLNALVSRENQYNAGYDIADAKSRGITFALRRYSYHHSPDAQERLPPLVVSERIAL